MIKEVQDRTSLKQFIRFPHTLYRDDPSYVPQLNQQQMAFLSLRNPFFEHSEAALFLAYNKGSVVGRIAAILNRNHLKKYDDQTGFFGFFDVYDDSGACRNLLGRTVRWLKEKGIKRIVGPENFSTNDSCGVLVDGFHEPPTFLMPYNKPYYQPLLLDYGFQPLMELYSYRIPFSTWEQTFHYKYEVIVERLQAAGITIRPIDMKNYRTEVNNLRRLYNLCNEDNWGFVPLSENEFAYMADELRKIVEPESILIAEKNGEPVGYLVAVPDFNQVLKHVRNGRLLPTGWMQFLTWKKHIDKVRMMIMGVHPDYRNRGIDGGFYVQLYHYMKKRGLKYIEPCYVMKDNRRMMRLLNHLKMEKINTYQILELQL